MIVPCGHFRFCMARFIGGSLLRRLSTDGTSHVCLSPGADHHRTLVGTYFPPCWGQEAVLARHWQDGYMTRQFARPTTSSILLSSTLPGPNTSEVKTLWRYRKLFIIIIIIIILNLSRSSRGGGTKINTRNYSSNGQSSERLSSAKLSCSRVALKRCIRTEIRWNR